METIDEYGLIGFPLKHSFSKKFFTDKFEKEHILASYSNFEISHVNKILEILENKLKIRGFNVTIPYKQDILSLLHYVSDEAREIGAVNVVKVSRTEGGTELGGYNSDVYGFMYSIIPLINSEIHKKALVLGTGGASKAVVYALKKIGIEALLVSRTSKIGRLSYDQLNEDIMLEYKVIINCTPLGTFPNMETFPDIPYRFLSNQHLLYDLVYNPEETLFLKKGKQFGASTKNGYQMLELQALAAWDIWNS